MNGRAAPALPAAAAPAQPAVCKQVHRFTRFRLPYNRTLVCLCIIGTILTIVVTSALALFYLRGHAEARVAANTQNLAKSLVLTFDGILDSIDVAIMASADEIARQVATGKPDAQEISRFLVRQQGRLPVMPYLRATNARGDIVHGQGLLATPLSVADRGYFAELRDNPSYGLYVSKPSLSRTSNTWMWLFARRINHADGAFGGVVYAVLNIDQIQAILANINLDAGGRIISRFSMIRKGTTRAICC